MRTIALALALACGFTAAGEAKKNVVRPAAKSARIKRAKVRKNKRVKRGQRPKAVVKHHAR